MAKAISHKLRGVLGVVFDMDGTLTIPSIDFGEMRRLIGSIVGQSPLEGDILHAIARLPVEKQKEAEACIRQVEEQASLKLMPGVGEVFAHLEKRGIHRGILTRNTELGVERFLRQVSGESDGFSDVVFVGRDTVDDDGAVLPPKPAARTFHHICSRMGVPPGQVLMVGDHLDDLLAGHNSQSAGAILISNSDYHKPPTSEHHRYALTVIQDLRELQHMLGSAPPDQDNMG